MNREELSQAISNITLAMGLLRGSNAMSAKVKNDVTQKLFDEKLRLQAILRNTK